ncbi:AfsR/SARP family transcriptional regulator [Blastococcus brunescens]|uniref:BTAD domain-containing putative transcriptional regulator n=1 Tax=Blastococcus brunescens TaxID=1564165 RepID=A0ABZ1B494_9ACTN|nr:BTAD domain-containing putative transcriptional regulator [Blastococcus sp. BMG 8361]WRL65534.1 BTAD domain-containing putative transcriptional regulator [Blastococcus sp. BMG 8361]
MPVERLTEAVWGDRPPADAAGALQAYVSHLRRRLQPGSAARARTSIIVSAGRGYAVRLPEDAVDVWRFERLLDRSGTAPAAATVQLVGEALALWRGPPLAEWTDEPWAEAEIARLAELRTVARERLMAVRLELGEAALLVPDLEAMVAEEPLREERWRLLALALYRANRQADALGALRRARTTLADELGVDPGPRCGSWSARCWPMRRNSACRCSARAPRRSERRLPSTSPRICWTGSENWPPSALHWQTSRPETHGCS